MLLGLGRHAFDQFEPTFQPCTDGRHGGLGSSGPHAEQFVGGDIQGAGQGDQQAGRRVFAVRAACEFVQMDGSNFSLLDENGRDLVRLAEILAAEEAAGTRKVEDDQLLKSALSTIYLEWINTAQDEKLG